MMDKLIDKFPDQLREAIEIGSSTALEPVGPDISNVVICGMGGSGIGGNLVQRILSYRSPVPVLINKEYDIPEFVNDKTLAIFSSYSGNTEETLEALEQAIDNNAHIAAVTSGGKLHEIAQKKGYHVIKIPGGDPPRACLGYSFVQQLFLLHHYRLIDDFFINEILNAAAHIEKSKDSIKSKAKQLAEELKDKLPVIYSSQRMEPVAIRYRQQINENAKMLAWHHTIPEMNHNELVGWRNENDQLAVLILRNKNDHPRIQRRIEINKPVMDKYASVIREVWSEGDTDIERMIWLIHFGDWLSWYLAEKRGMDSMEIKVIDHLKNELSGVK